MFLYLIFFFIFLKETFFKNIFFSPTQKNNKKKEMDKKNVTQTQHIQTCIENQDSHVEMNLRTCSLSEDNNNNNISHVHIYTKYKEPHISKDIS